MMLRICQILPCRGQCRPGARLFFIRAPDLQKGLYKKGKYLKPTGASQSTDELYFLGCPIIVLGQQTSQWNARHRLRLLGEAFPDGWVPYLLTDNSPLSLSATRPTSFYSSRANWRYQPFRGTIQDYMKHWSSPFIWLIITQRKWFHMFLAYRLILLPSSLQWNLMRSCLDRDGRIFFCSRFLQFLSPILWSSAWCTRLVLILHYQEYFLQHHLFY